MATFLEQKTTRAVFNNICKRTNGTFKYYCTPRRTVFNVCKHGIIQYNKRFGLKKKNEIIRTILNSTIVRKNDTYQ